MSTRAIDQTRRCTSMAEVRTQIDALDDILVPLLVTRSGYMREAARIKARAELVRDEARIQQIVDRVRPLARTHGGSADLMERLYRAMMECYIAYEHEELQRLQAAAASGQEEPTP
ncbi:MAG: chorismate mutase [Pseudomonadota bacterium]|nr:chorismate mutase [Pseudomonadota bacterium]